jgi:FdhD protein
METFEIVPVIKIVKGQSEKINDTVVTEIPFTIWLNGRELATIICTPTHQRELAVGFLFSERIVTDYDDILSIEIDEERSLARIEAGKTHPIFTDTETTRFITPGCFFGTASITGQKKIESPLRVGSAQILDLMIQSARKSHIYRTTGGVHSAALCTPDDILIIREDIGRHNAIDKVIGHRMLEGIVLDDHMLITSGRISSAVIGKIINARIPVIVSSSAPTTEATKLALAFGITLVGFARGKRMNVYTGEERITSLR